MYHISFIKIEPPILHNIIVFQGPRPIGSREEDF